MIKTNTWINSIAVALFISVGAISLSSAQTIEKLQVMESNELVPLAWEAAQNQNFELLENISNVAQEAFGFQAQQLHYTLDAFPGRDRVEDYKVLNDLTTILFIRAESLMHRGANQMAIESFQEIIDQYPWSQAWDPSRGQYWPIAEKAQASIDIMTGKTPATKNKKNKRAPKTKVKLHFKGTHNFIDYTEYGRFENVGTTEYKYVITDKKALAEAVGEGIYPNPVKHIYKDPAYKEALRQGRLEGSHWDFVQTDDLQAAFLKWATAPEATGVKLFYIANILEKSNLWAEAVKAYHALVIHFPDTVAWTYWQTPWYPAQAAIGKLKHILREHPELKLHYEWAKIEVQNSSDNSADNDVFISNPGTMKRLKGKGHKKDAWGSYAAKEKLGKIIRTIGEGKVTLVQYENKHWQMLVDGKPYMIKGIMYAPTKVGQSPDQKTLGNWMEEDFNKNGLVDGPYDAWVDKNRNNKQDENEKAVGDFQLLKEMGVNTIRLYHHPDEPVKEVLRDMYERYGIMVIIGDFLGKYTIGSGATWFEGTDYENKKHKKNMMASVRKMVETYKDEPYVLMWSLGNENNYGVASNGDKKPEAYFKFANEVAKMMKELDPNHPVSLVNGDTLFLDIYAEHAPDIDIFSANVYRGDYGFGSFWDQVRDATDKPTYIKEYGAPAYGHRMTLMEAEEAQAAYHRGNWFDILENSAGYAEGAGNSIGSVIFQYLDEWWKNYEPSRHDTETEVIGPFPGGYYFEEWFGIVSQGDGSHSPFMRQPRKAYDTYKKLWN